MDENMSEDERPDSPVDRNRQDNAKRMKTDFEVAVEESSASSSNSSHNTEQSSGSTTISSDSGVPNSGKSFIDPVTKTSENQGNTEQEKGPSEEGERERESGEDEDLDSVLSASVEYQSNHSTSSENTIIHSTDTESDEEDIEGVLKKDKPKHAWFVLPEIMNRQMGYGSKRSNPSLFQQRCYGSLRNVQRLELMYKLEEHDGCVNSLNFSPNGSLLASGSDDLKVVLWDWKIGKSFMKINTRHRRNIFQTKFLDLRGPDIHLATCARDGLVCYSQIGQEGLRDSRKLGQHRGPCHKLTALKDQPHVVLSAGEDGIVFSHDVRRTRPERIVHVKCDEREVALYSIHSHPLKSHEFCVAGRESSVKVYDQRKTSHHVAAYCPFKENNPKLWRGLHVTCAMYNHDGSEILASYNDEDVYLFDTDRPVGHFAHRYSGHRNGATIKGVSFFGPRSEFIMSGSDCGHVFFWEKKTEAIAQFLLADDNGVVNCLEPHPQLPFLATSGLDWDVKVWVPSCEEEPTLEGLATTVKDNKRNSWNRSQDSLDESQVLWMLWRRLRASRIARNEPDSPARGFSPLNLESSGSDSSSDSWRSSHSEDEDLGDDAPGCATS